MPRLLLDALNETIGRSTGRECHIAHLTEAGGDRYHARVSPRQETKKWFVKLNDIELLAMFEAEADGLRALAKCPAIRAPRVVGSGSAGQQAYLILEYLDMHSLRDGAASISAGRVLADLHRMQGNSFGWSRDNFIGSTPQSNRVNQNWPDFFLPGAPVTANRTRPSAQWHGSAGRQGGTPGRQVYTFFADYRPTPSLLHGIRGGNAAVDADGKLVLFDPAVHFATARPIWP